MIIQHSPFENMIHCNLTRTIDWGCRWQHLTMTRSVDSLGPEFLDFLDQASGCHAGTARSLWLHRCGMGCPRYWCWGILLNSWHGRNSWSLVHPGCQCCRCSGCRLHVLCRWGWCATEKQYLVRACSVAVVPLGTVLTALTLHSQRCLHMQQYVEPLLVYTW